MNILFASQIKGHKEDKKYSLALSVLVTEEVYSNFH